ncbi:hypothetical protein [Agrobacterium pusense]|uniref:Uncharacterized protein n=1 Tax=Agrobacterium pusense TaxID=648995 RepID=A0A6H0ZHA4_9HYPH|nr:hypothetical protein [Agrobacterium pusense]QIX20216.1 hypothetical protein FOB41_03200 [Agrobacterium pusense]
MKDLYHGLNAVQAIAPAVAAAAADGAAVDLIDHDAALFVINTGAIAGAGDFAVKLQESDASGSGFTDVAAADQLGTLPATLAANTAYRVGYIGSKRKRFVRLSVTKAGGTSIALGAVAVLGVPRIVTP